MVDVPYDRWFIQQVCVVSAFSKDPPLFLIQILQLKTFSMEILQKYSLQKLGSHIEKIYNFSTS